MGFRVCLEGQGDLVSKVNNTYKPQNNQLSLLLTRLLSPLDPPNWVCGLGALRSRFPGWGFRIQGLELRVWGLGSRAWGLG